MHCLTHSLHSFNKSFVPFWLFLHWLELQDHWLEKIISFHKKFYWVVISNKSDQKSRRKSDAQASKSTEPSLSYGEHSQNHLSAFFRFYLNIPFIIKIEILCKAFWKVKALVLSFNVAKVSSNFKIKSQQQIKRMVLDLSLLKIIILWLWEKRYFLSVF